MNIDGARALLMRLNPLYGFDGNAKVEPNRFYIEVIQTLLNAGYRHGPVYVRDTTPAEQFAVVRRVVLHILDTTKKAWALTPSTGFHDDVIAELLRNPPPAKPSGGFTQADMDAAEKRGYERCKADVARLRA